MSYFMNLSILSLLFSSLLFADVQNSYPTVELINSDTKIIDIRTEGEWRETGILKGSYPITFFDEKGNYDVSQFLSSLNRVVKKDEKFALICRSGSRTKVVSNFLSRNGYKVINLNGGIIHAIQKIGIRPVPYNSNMKIAN